MKPVLAYFKLAADHPDYAAALAVLKTDFAQAYPGNELSVNLSADGSQAWVKCCADSDPPDAVVIDTCTLESVARVQQEVGSEAWTGPRPQRGPRPR